jgi:hypothetical protein
MDSYMARLRVMFRGFCQNLCQAHIQEVGLTQISTYHVQIKGLRAGLDLESGLKNGLGWKKSTPLIGREVGTRLFKFTP